MPIHRYLHRSPGSDADRFGAISTVHRFGLPCLLSAISLFGNGFSAMAATGIGGKDATAGASKTVVEPDPQEMAATAATKLSKGDYAGAAQLVVRAQRATPADASLHSFAGVLLLQTGDGPHARIAFQNALICGPDDPLALYGLGLAQLACGDRAGALQSLSRSEHNGGEPAHILVARNYIELLNGAQIALADAGLPEGFAAAQHTLTGFNAYRHHDVNQAVAELLQAQNLLAGDAIVEPGGVLMTFDTTQPLTGGANGLSKATVVDGLVAPLPAQRGLSGVVQVAPENLIASVGYVTFEIDARAQGIVNTAPFALTIDTRPFANGWHTLTIVTYDAQANEIDRRVRRIRVFNTLAHTGTDGDSTPAGKASRLRSALWDALTLRPDRYPCTYTLGLVQQRAGNQTEARRWFARACALHPDSVEARRGWISSGGSSIGAEAMWGGLPDEKVVAFTFDDGPKPGLTEPLLDLLTSLRVPATFFVIGRHVMEYPDLTRQLDAAGMEIANHSYTHPNLTHISTEQVAREIMETQAAVETVTGKTPRYLRPPGGNWNGTVAGIVRQWGLTPCMWTVDVYGSEVIGAQQVADAVLAQVRPGSVVLMHNGKLSTLQALPTIIKELRARGYTFATVDALAKRLAASREAARRTAAAYARTRHSE